MRHLRPKAAPALVCVLAATFSACQQSDQELPFELEAGQSASIGASGGVIGVPPNFSMQFPAGSLSGTTQVTAAARLTAFPSTAGLVVPGTAFDVGPAGTPLNPNAPARVQIAVPSSLLDAGQDLRLAVALLRPGGSIVTSATSYDLANGILTANVHEIGPVAAVVALDAIQVQSLASIPSLGGGSVAPPAPQPAGPAPTSHGGATFTAECSGEERSCFTSGIVQIWADQVVRSRLGNDIVLMNSSVSASLEFLSFNQLNLPTQVVGYIQIDGELRARINRVVSSRRLADELVLHTGAGATPSPTTVTFSGNVMTLAQTSEGPNEMFDYGVAGIGTGEQITIRLEGELEFTNSSGPPSIGQIAAHVRLRR